METLATHETVIGANDALVLFADKNVLNAPRTVIGADVAEQLEGMRVIYKAGNFDTVEHGNIPFYRFDHNFLVGYVGSHDHQDPELRERALNVMLGML